MCKTILKTVAKKQNVARDYVSFQIFSRSRVQPWFIWWQSVRYEKVFSLCLVNKFLFEKEQGL